MTDPLVNNDLLPLSYCKVVGRFLGAVADSTDTGSNPDAIPLTGKITLAPNVRGAILVNQAQPDPARRLVALIRAGVENRAMVTALGIDVRRSFTLVFAIGGAAAGIGGVLAMHYTTFVSAHLGATLLIFAFIVTGLLLIVLGILYARAVEEAASGAVAGGAD